MSTASGPPTVAPWRQFSRLVIELLARPVLPALRLGEADALQRASRLNARGAGLLILINHFSLRDPLQVMTLTFSDPQLRACTIFAPTAYHQAKTYGLLGRALSNWFAIDMLPVVTRETVRRMGKSVAPREGLSEYRQTAAAQLAQGQLVLLAPQGGRRQRLGATQGSPVGKLLEQLSDEQAERVALLPVGLGIDQRTSYARTEVGGLNLFRRYVAHVGAVRLVSELRREGVGAAEVDAWVFDRLRQLVPADYAKG